MLVIGPHQGPRDLQKTVEESNAHEEPHGPIPRDGDPTPSPNGLSETGIINGHTLSLLFVLGLLSLQISQYMRILPYRAVQVLSYSWYRRRNRVTDTQLGSVVACSAAGCSRFPRRPLFSAIE